MIVAAPVVGRAAPEAARLLPAPEMSAIAETRPEATVRFAGLDGSYQPTVGASAIVIVIAPVVALPALFVAVTVNVYEPAIVGVPPKIPVDGSNVMPVGIAPDPTENVGALLAANVYDGKGLVAIHAVGGAEAEKIGGVAAWAHKIAS